MRTIVWWRVVLWVVLAALAVMAPQVLAEGDVNRLSEVIYISVAALALALLTGFNGQISLGHGAFLGMGAYITMILTVDYGVSYAVAGIIAVAFTFVVGLIVGLPALRITGIYLALVTLALATLFPQIVVRLGDITGATVGRGLIPREGYGDSAFLEEVGRRKFLFQAGFRAPDWTDLQDDPLGTLLETAAEVAGVHVSRYKVLTFGLSAGIAAVGGWMFAVLNNQVSPTSFTIALSITLLVAAVLGGANSIIGPVIGAFIIVYLREAVPAESQRYTQVIFGAVLILVMLVAPGGIVGVYRQTLARIRRTRSQRATPAAPEPDAASV